MKHENIATFFVGCVVFLILAIVMMVVGTIWLDMNSIQSFSLGLGGEMIYSFTKSGEGFSFQTGAGLLVVPIAGGLLSVGLKALTKRYLILK